LNIRTQPSNLNHVRGLSLKLSETFVAFIQKHLYFTVLVYCTGTVLGEKKFMFKDKVCEIIHNI